MLPADRLPATCSSRSVFSLSIDSTSQLDLTDNALVLPSSAFSSIDDLRALVLAGRGGADFGNATWHGLGGIASSAAASDQFAYALGYARNDLLPLGALSSIYGQTLASNDYIVRFTHAADATLDGVVDDDDTTIVGAYYDGGATSGHQWYEGDFDYDATVDDDDVTLLGSAASGPVTSPLSPPLADAAPAVRDDFYYNESWQLLQIDRTIGEGDSQPYERYAYDPRYIDAPILRDRDLDADGVIDPSDADERIYLTQDANFNNTSAVDVAGDVVERYHYTDPTGKHVVLDGDWTTDADGQSDIEATNLYAGYVFDSETGMYLARHRFYAPNIGTWISRDPIGYGDGMNVFQYVKSSAPMHRDPFGLRICCTFDRSMVKGPGDVNGQHLPPRPSTTTSATTKPDFYAGNGIIFTCRFGWIDTAHVRDAMDEVKRIAPELQSAQKNGETELVAWGSRQVRLNNIPAGLDGIAPIAAQIAYDNKFAYEVSDPAGEMSAFSPEDLPSNLLGVLLALRVLGKGGNIPNEIDWARAMDQELAGALEELGAVDRHQALAIWDASIEGKWATSGPLVPKPTLHRRNFSPTAMTVSCDACKGVAQSGTPPKWLSMDALNQFAYEVRNSTSDAWVAHDNWMTSLVEQAHRKWDIK